MESPTSKDIVLAVISGSVSLAGLLLVFSGFLFAQANSFDPEHVGADTEERYKKAARFAVIPFLLCLVVAGLSVCWLRSQSPILLSISWIGFLLLLALTAIYGGFVILRYL